MYALSRLMVLIIISIASHGFTMNDDTDDSVDDSETEIVEEEEEEEDKENFPTQPNVPSAAVIAIKMVQTYKRLNATENLNNLMTNPKPDSRN